MLAQRSVKRFGHIFSEQGLLPYPDKVENIKKWPEPKDKTELRVFVEQCNSVRCAPDMRMQETDKYLNVTVMSPLLVPYNNPARPAPVLE